MADEPARGLDEAARHDHEWGPRAKALADRLSDGDKSVLIAMLGEKGDDDVVAMTSRGSPNDWFWAHLSRVGLMEPREDKAPEALKAVVVPYALTDEGRRILPLMLRGFF